MLREPPAGCQEPRPGGGPMGGGAFHPRRKRQSRGRGDWGGLHSGPRPQTWVASGWTVKGAGRGPSIWDQLWLLLWANNGPDTKKPAWICHCPPFRAEQGKESKRLGRGDRQPATWTNLTPPPNSLWSLFNCCLPTELGDTSLHSYYQGDPK